MPSQSLPVSADERRKILGRQPEYAAFMALFVCGLLAWLMPQYAEIYTLITVSIFVCMCILSLSLGLVWGYGGIFCLGQAAFFGLGGYVYAIAALNLENTLIGALAAILLPALFAAMVGYFLFWGRIGDVYVGVITLTITLIFTQFLNGSAGDAYRIGVVPLGGFNGIPATPQLSLSGSLSEPFSIETIFRIIVLALGITYAGCRFFLRSTLGKSMVGARENETRMALLGYDTRVVKLVVFCVGAAMAGMAGMLFANCLTVTPNMFSLSNTVYIVIWVLIGGRGTLLGPIVGCLFVQLMSSYLGKSGVLNPELISGAVLLLFVLLIPNGLVPSFMRLGGTRRQVEFLRRRSDGV
ncbi:branched-chain amino acid ABC transporter permease [Pusillimonas sp.]|uniref:branched-chain amino acid ABC transporter permease n=1 Tax=Pusillimonas sp. TaxID=3040095 RepID=UPI0037CA1498